MEKVINRLRERKVLFFVLADAFASVAGFLLAFIIRFDGSIPSEYFPRLPYYLALFAGLNLIFLFRERLFAFTWAFVGLKELTRLFRALTYASVIFALFIFLDRDTFGFFPGFPRSVIVLSYFFTIVLVGGIRISKRLWIEISGGRISNLGEPTLVVGAGRSGEHLIRSVQGSEGPYNLIGIVDNHERNQNIFIHGIPVIGYVHDIPKIAKDEGIKHVIVAFERDHVKEIREAVESARNAGIVNIKIVPEFSQLLGKTLSFRDLRELSVEDLLSRDPAKLDTEEIRKFIHGKTVLVTGAAGSIGAEICRQTAQFLPSKLILLDFNETGVFDLDNEMRLLYPNAEFVPVIADITDRKKIDRILDIHKPNIIFHAAAYKHVPLLEQYPEEAIKVNVFGTLNLAKLANAHHVENFVMISTDKVVIQNSIMGKTKLIAEKIISSLNAESGTKYVSVRFGNVLASRGSVIPIFQEQIKRGGPVTVTHPDMIRYFMTIPEAALLVTEAGAVGTGGELFVLDMGKPIKILDLARELIELSGYTPDVDIPISIIGIRPGETLHEDVLTEDEKKRIIKTK